MELVLPLSPISVPSVLAQSDSDLCFRMILTTHLLSPKNAHRESSLQCVRLAFFFHKVAVKKNKQREEILRPWCTL